MNRSEIDAGVLGALIRHERQEQGYSTAEDFAMAIKVMTGYSVSKDTLYNIESGKQEPKLSLFLAIEHLLFPKQDMSLSGNFSVALPKQWQSPLIKDIDMDEYNYAFGEVYLDVPSVAKRRAQCIKRNAVSRIKIELETSTDRKARATLRYFDEINNREYSMEFPVKTADDIIANIEKIASRADIDVPQDTIERILKDAAKQAPWIQAQ